MEVDLDGALEEALNQAAGAEDLGADLDGALLVAVELAAAGPVEADLDGALSAAAEMAAAAAEGSVEHAVAPAIADDRYDRLATAVNSCHARSYGEEAAQGLGKPIDPKI